MTMAMVVLSIRFAGLPRATVGPDADPAPPGASAQPAYADAMEHWLASLPSDPALVRVGTRAAEMGLEDRIAQVDDLLSAARAAPAQPARLSALQEQRVRLVGALVQVRYAETLADEAR